MKAAISDMRGETRRTREKVREVVSRPAYALAPPSQALPAGAVPAFVTADKKLQLGSITITPGGFVAAESVFRSRTEQADIGQAYQNIPFGPLAGTNEFRFSARQSRISALIESPITPNAFASAYGELDFLGSGATSNENESNSFVPRIRHLYGQLDFAEYGLHTLAGQTWSLATMNSKGITPRNEVTPPTIDAQYVPGFVWKRQPQIRVTKDFNRNLWVSLSAEEPQTTYTGCATGVNGTTVTSSLGVAQPVTCNVGGANNLNGTAVTNFSLNHIPDIVGKAAYEAHVADRDVHLETFGMYRDLYDRVAYTAPLGGVQPYASNKDSTGYGVGGGLIVPVIPKRLDFQASGMIGRGIGSYGTAQFTDATFNSNGSASPIREEMLLGGFTAHVTPAVDLYAFGGMEQVHADTYSINTVGVITTAGYGVATANNSGCFNDITAGSCAGNAKRVWQLTGGMWDKLYKGPFGEVRVGVQYSYTQRELFAGTGTTAPLPAVVGSPKQDEQSVLTSFRYYPFQ